MYRKWVTTEKETERGKKLRVGDSEGGGRKIAWVDNVLSFLWDRGNQARALAVQRQSLRASSSPQGRRGHD